MIGLVDYDLWENSSTRLYVPNLEIMKLATYYKLEKRHFCRLISPEETELVGYDKIYFFSEQPECQVPEAFKRFENIEYGGLAFTRGKYKPFENEIIDYTLPKTFIYKDFLQTKYADGIKSKDINHFLDDSYYRIYAGDNKLPIPPMMKNKRIFLYDVDFFYPDWKEVLQELSNRKPSSIVRVHPVYCTNLTQFFEIRTFPKFARTNEIILDLPIPLNELNVLFKKYERKFLADITQSSNVFLPLGGTLKSNELYYKDFIYKINLLYSFWSKNIPIKIKYIQPSKGTYNPLEKISQKVENWANLSTPVKKKNTLMDRIKKETEEYDNLIKLHPSAADLFNQSFDDLKERRLWRI